VSGGTWSSSGYTFTKNSAQNANFCIANNLQIGATYQLTFTATGSTSVTLSSVDVVGDAWGSFLALTGTAQTYTSNIITATYSKVFIYTTATASGTTVTLSAISLKRMDTVVSGNLGVGVTNPLHKLHVAGTVLTNAGSFVSTYPDLNGGAGSNMTITAGNGAFGSIECYKTNNVDATSKLPLALQAYGGRVGIGTTAPSALLHVNGSSTAGDRDSSLIVSTQRAGLYLNSLGSGGKKWNIWSALSGESCPAGSLAFFDESNTAFRMVIDNTGRVGIGNAAPAATLQVNGTGIICGGTNFGNTNNYMALGSLTLGATNKNYGAGSGWNGNTAGLLMECSDNTEIAIHDAGDRVVSFMYYAGNRFTIGRDMGWGSTPTFFGNYLQITQTNGNVLQLGNNANGVIYYTNPNGSNTHWGYPSGGGSDNYIRGTQTYIDTPTQIYGGLTVPNGTIECANQPFCIVGCVGGASVGYGVGQVIGSLGYMYAYSSAGMTNSGTSGWNSSFGRFYFTKTGRWQVNWSFYWNNFAAGSRVAINRMNSGLVFQESRYCALNAGGIGGDTTQAYSTLFYANAGDILECSFTNGSGTIYFGGITHTHCTYHFIA